MIDIDNERPRSQEWRKLPRQPWEFQAGAAIDPTYVDRSGFDSRSKIVFKEGQGLELPYLATTERIEPLAQISAGREPSKVLSLGYTVFIEGRDRLQVGEIYTVIGGASQLRDADNHLMGFIYIVNGRIKITGVKDGQFVGEVISMINPIERGDLIIPFQSMVKNSPPIAGPSPVQAHILIDHVTTAIATSQYRTVLIDRGKDDGVRPGMVFRIFQKVDPESGKQITDSDFLSLSDVQVVSSSERISIGLVLNGVHIIGDGDPATLLTDISDVGLHNRAAEKVLDFGEELKEGPDNKKKDEVQALDQLDVGGSIGSKEAKELRQLERWDEKGGKNVPSTSPTELENFEKQVDPSLKGKAPDDSDLDLDAPSIPEPETTPSKKAPEAAPVETAPAAPEPKAAQDSTNSELDELDAPTSAKSAPQASSKSSSKPKSTKPSTDDSDLDELMDH